MLIASVVLLSILALLPDADVDHDAGYTSSELRIRETVDGSVTSTSYVNPDGIITDAIDMGYATVCRMQDDNGRVVEERYLDANGDPVARYDDYYGLSYRIEFEGESLYVFDLVAAEVFHERKKKQFDEVMPTETSAENKEEAQPVNTRKGYYPDDIAGSFGVPVEQHRQESEVRQMDGYVSVGMLTGLPGQQQNT